MGTITSNGENLFFPTDTSSSTITDNPVFKFDNMNGESLRVNSVNNYFKSMKEIEAEFIASMNSAKTTLKNMLSDISQFGNNLIYMDGDINFPDPDNFHHGYMEENY
jgi:hypothetical protein